MKLSAEGAHLIERFEGFSSAPYRDAVGVWTIGYGSTKGVGPSTPHISRAEAEARLEREVDAVYGAAVNSLRLPLTQNQFDALTSFVYNLGPGVIVDAHTSVARALSAHDWRGVADAMTGYVYAGGRVLAGLVARRKLEAALFLKAEPHDPLEGYTASEVRWIREYDKLHRADQDRDRQRVLRRVMLAQRKRIWVAAEHDPQGRVKGWAKARRRARYNSLLARTR